MTYQKPYQPWYDDKRDYSTNAPTYYDYLANSIELERTQTEAINDLLVRDVNFFDSDEIHVDKLTDWHEDDSEHSGQISFKAHVITSPSSTTQTIDGTDYNASNGIQVLHDGLYAPDYKKVLDKYSADSNAKFTTLTTDLKNLTTKHDNDISTVKQTITTNINQVNANLTNKEQVITSERGTININHGTNGTNAKTKVDTNPQTVLEHNNLKTSNKIVKVHTAGSNDTTIGLDGNFINQVDKATSDIAGKQDKLSAGTGINISNNIISTISVDQSTRNLVLKSGDLTKPNKWGGTTNTTVRANTDYYILETKNATSNEFGGIAWDLALQHVNAGEQFSIYMPVYIDSSVAIDGDLCFSIKQHPDVSAVNHIITTTSKDKWFIVQTTFTINKSADIGKNAFWVYLVKNGKVRIMPPMIVRGNLIPQEYQPAFEDLQSQNLQNPDIYSWHKFSNLTASGDWGIEYYNDINSHVYNIKIKPGVITEANQGSPIAQQSISVLLNAGVPQDFIDKAVNGYVFRTGYYLGDTLNRVGLMVKSDKSANTVTIYVKYYDATGTIRNTQVVQGHEATPIAISYTPSETAALSLIPELYVDDSDFTHVTD